MNDLLRCPRGGKCREHNVTYVSRRVQTKGEKRKMETVLVHQINRNSVTKKVRSILYFVVFILQLSVFKNSSILLLEFSL